jgi:hypothetical protein
MNILFNFPLKREGFKLLLLGNRDRQYFDRIVTRSGGKAEITGSKTLEPPPSKLPKFKKNAQPSPTAMSKRDRSSQQSPEIIAPMRRPQTDR